MSRCKLNPCCGDPAFCKPPKQFDESPSAATTGSALLALRIRGWNVTVHYDIRIDEKTYTFWLFTHPSGKWVQGLASTDVEALQECLKQADRVNTDAAPPQPPYARIHDSKIEMTFATPADAEAYWIKRLRCDF